MAWQLALLIGPNAFAQLLRRVKPHHCPTAWSYNTAGESAIYRMGWRRGSISELEYGSGCLMLLLLSGLPLGQSELKLVQPCSFSDVCFLSDLQFCALLFQVGEVVHKSLRLHEDSCSSLLMRSRYSR